MTNRRARDPFKYKSALIVTRSGRHLKAKCNSVIAVKLIRQTGTLRILVDIRHRIHRTNPYGTISDLGRARITASRLIYSWRLGLSWCSEVSKLISSVILFRPLQRRRNLDTSGCNFVSLITMFDISSEHTADKSREAGMTCTLRPNLFQAKFI